MSKVRHEVRNGLYGFIEFDDLEKQLIDSKPFQSENALSSMTRQCITGRRFATVAEVRMETTAWHEYSNDRQRGVDWQFKVDDARLKLKSIYPKLEV